MLSTFEIVKQDVCSLGADAALINSEYNRYWFTGFHSTAGYVLVTKEQAYLVIDARYFEAAKVKVTNCKVLLLKRFSDLVDIIHELKINKLLIESEYCTYEEFTRYQAYFGCSISGVISRRWRIVKDEKALTALKKAAEIGAVTINWVRTQPIIGKTEKEVATMIAIHMLELGASGNSFDLIVATGKNGAIPHHAPDDTVLEEGNLVTVDIGCIYDYYCSDITRTFALGDHLNDPRLKQIYDTVFESQRLGFEAVKAGVTGDYVDAQSRDYIDNRSPFKGYFTHSTGHGVGLEVHELPYVSPHATEVLKANEVFTVEPGVYIPGVGGVRIEDTLIVTDGKPIVITGKATKNLFNNQK